PYCAPCKEEIGIMSVTERTSVPAGVWSVDPVHSTVGFAVKHLGVASFRGGFDDFSVTLDATGTEPRLEGAVRAESVVVAQPQLKGHLLSPDFFDAECFPEITYVSRSFEVSGDGSVVVEGDLTLKGHTAPVTARGGYYYVEADLGGGERLGLELEAVIDRTEF